MALVAPSLLESRADTDPTGRSRRLSTLEPNLKPMALDQLDQRPGLRFLFTVAVGFILVQGLRFAEPIILPIALAAFLAVICLPAVHWLQARGIPFVVAIPVTVLAVASVLGLLILVGIQQLDELQSRIVAQGAAIRPELDIWLTEIETRFSLLEEGDIRNTVLGLIDIPTLASLATDATTWALSFVSGVFIVLLLLGFTLGEAAVFPRKLARVAGNAVASNERLAAIVAEVQGYLVIKTIASLATGVLLGSWTWSMGVELPILLGLIAFVLNYVPTLGSIMAAIPAIVLALVQVDVATGDFLGVNMQRTIAVGLGYLTVNVCIGNWLEPTLMGRRLGLSTLVVVLSLLFWGWLWGPIGAVLSVPLTMVAKIMLEHTSDLKWLATMLGKAPGEDDATSTKGKA